jgi:hypothetical protein
MVEVCHEIFSVWQLVVLESMNKKALIPITATEGKAL